jgi:hypothetical protein
MQGAKTIEWLETKGLIPYAKNSRTHSDAQVAQIAGSIKEFGFNNPVLIDEDNGIIAGHGRVMAAQKLGLQAVPCIRLAHLSDTQRKAYVIADNRLALNAGWDDQMLTVELQELDSESFDLSLLGFEADELNALLNPIKETEGLTDEDEVPEVPEEPVTKPGDIYKLGRHRLMCGDSTSIDAVEKLMDGQRADMVFTDPPYGFNYVKKSDGSFIQNDGDEFEDVIRDALSLVQCDTYFVCGDAKTARKFLAATEHLGEPKSLIVWAKPIQHRMHKFEPCHEFIWYWGENGSPFYGSNVFEAKRAIEKVHPTVKPIELIEYCLGSVQKNKVVDFFGGSGTTMIACEKLGRTNFTMELDPKYCDVIVKRWEKFTGQKAERV